MTGNYLRWSYHTGGRVQGDPALGPDGSVFVTSADGMLYAINASGQLKWKFAATGRPALSPDGATLYTSDSGNIRAVRADTGVTRWTCKPPEVDGIAVGVDGSLYATASGYKLLKVSSAGYSAGPHSFLAVATDFVGGTSNVLSATLQFVAAP